MKAKFTYKSEVTWILIFGLLGPVIGFLSIIIIWILNLL